MRPFPVSQNEPLKIFLLLGMLPCSCRTRISENCWETGKQALKHGLACGNVFPVLWERLGTRGNGPAPSAPPSTTTRSRPARAGFSLMPLSDGAPTVLQMVLRQPQRRVVLLRLVRAEAANAAPRGELLEVPGGHYAPFMDQHETVAEAEIEFLNRHLR